MEEIPSDSQGETPTSSDVYNVVSFPGRFFAFAGLFLSAYISGCKSQRLAGGRPHGHESGRESQRKRHHVSSELTLFPLASPSKACTDPECSALSVIAVSFPSFLFFSRIKNAKGESPSTVTQSSPPPSDVSPSPLSPLTRLFCVLARVEALHSVTARLLFHRRSPSPHSHLLSAAFLVFLDFTTVFTQAAAVCRPLRPSRSSSFFPLTDLLLSQSTRLVGA